MKTRLFLLSQYLLPHHQLSGSDYSELAKQVPGINKLAGAGALGQLSQLGGLLGKSEGVSETATSAVSNVANAGGEDNSTWEH